MSVTEDETQALDAGWDDDSDVPSAPSDAPSSRAVGSSSNPPSLAAATEEVDEGWDDMPAPSSPGATPSEPSGKRRRHRERRKPAAVVVGSQNPATLPRPAERTKKDQREQARRARAHEAAVREQKKAEKKAARAAEAREQAAARLRQTQAEEQARKAREEARERQRLEKRAASGSVRPQTRQSTAAASSPAPVTSSKVQAEVASSAGKSRKLGVGVLLALLAFAAAVVALLTRK